LTNNLGKNLDGTNSISTESGDLELKENPSGSASQTIDPGDLNDGDSYDFEVVLASGKSGNVTDDVVVNLNSSEGDSVVADRTITVNQKSSGRLVYGRSSDLRVYNAVQDNENDPPDSGSVEAIGANASDILGNGDVDIPYADSTGMYVTSVGASSDTQIFAESSFSPGIKTSKTRLSVGKWPPASLSGNLILFAIENSTDSIYSADGSGNTKRILKTGNGVEGVSGVADIDGDGQVEMVFVDSSQQLRYLNQDGTTTKISNGGVGSNNSTGFGPPVDFTGDGTIRIPFIDGSNDPALVTAGGVFFLAWLSREVEKRDLPRVAYPAATFGLAIGGMALFALVLPDLFGFFVAQVDRVLGFVTSPGTAAGTIGEAQPIDISDLADSYKLAGFTAIAGGVFLLLKQLLEDEPRGGELLFVVWGLFMLAATLTQLRFEYYLTLVVGGLNAALAGYVMALISPSDREVTIESYQVFTVAAIVLVIVVPMFLVSPTVMEWSDGKSQPANSVQWDDNLEWMNENTPEPGRYANPDGEPMEPFGTFDETDDYDYPPGSYGVISWWDYGHWITSEAERIPVANPFQQGVRDAGDFLLAQNESEAMTVLESVDEDGDAQVKYVMVDWKMVQTDTALSGKYFAPADFSSEYQRSDFYSRIIDRELSQQFGFVAGTSVMRHKQPYYNSMAVRLYKYHGSAKEPQPYVLNWEGAEQDLGGGDTFTSTPQGEPTIRFYNSTAEAREAAQSETAQLGGVGPHPAERVPALEHFRLVYMGETSALSRGAGQQSGADFDFQRTARNNNLGQRLVQEVPKYSEVQPNAALADFLFETDPAWTKTFERVDGATIEGTTNPGADVMVTVTLQPGNGTQFTYRQRTTADGDGEFNATVPYATTGYDEWGLEEGYTDTNVRAQGPYEVQSLLENETTGAIEAFEVGRVNVTEGQVLGEDDSPATVELESLTQEQNVTIEPGEGEEGGDEGTDGGTEESTSIKAEAGG